MTRFRFLGALATLAFLSACGGGGGGQDGPGPTKLVSVEYRVDGTATQGAMTYSNASEGTSQVTANLPWNVKFTSTKAGQFVYISAQNQNDTGSVHVSIFLNGTLYKESISSGAFVIATASGSTP